ncbi:hypothetical protein EV2_006429 [Malus domestica]
MRSPEELAGKDEVEGARCCGGRREGERVRCFFEKRSGCLHRSPLAPSSSSDVAGAATPSESSSLWPVSR